MFGRAIWDKLPECIIENVEIAQVKQGQFLNFQKSREWFNHKIAQTKHLVTASSHQIKKHSVLKLKSLNSRELQISEQAITKQPTNHYPKL